MLLSTQVAHAVVGTEEIAQALVQTTASGDPKFTGFRPSSVATDAQLVMRVPLETLPMIEKYGFMNQFQSKTSRGSFAHSMRLNAEGVMVQLTLPIEPKSLHPKYGTLHIDRKDGVKGKYNTFHYGPVIFVFGRHVLPRTTVSDRDSLGSPTTVFPVSDTKSLARAFSNYPEAQVWGDLDLSDVEMIIIDDTSRAIESAIKDFASRNSIDVYTVPGNVGDSTAVLRPPHITLLHAFSHKRPRFRPSRVLTTPENLRAEIRSGLTAPLLHWLSVVAPELIVDAPSAVSIGRSGWAATDFGAKPAYETDPKREFRDARVNTIAGLEHIYSQAASRPALRAAIIRYFRNEKWIPKRDRERMEETLSAYRAGSAEIKDWINIWASRSTAIAREDADFPIAVAEEIERVEAKPDSIEKERTVAALEVIEEKPKSRAKAAADSEDVFHQIKQLIKEIRHGESEKLRRLALGAFAKILSNSEMHGLIAQKFVRNERFAQVIYRHSDDLDRDFLRVFLRFLQDSDKQEPAQTRAIKKCTELLGVSA